MRRMRTRVPTWRSIRSGVFFTIAGSRAVDDLQGATAPGGLATGTGRVLGRDRPACASMPIASRRSGGLALTDCQRPALPAGLSNFLAQMRRKGKGEISTSSRGSNRFQPPSACWRCPGAGRGEVASSRLCAQNRLLEREFHTRAGSRFWGSRLERPRDPAHELALRRGADPLRGGLAVLEQDHRRDRANAELARDIRILVDVELDDLDLRPELRGDFVEQRRDDAARAAPFGPEIDEDGRFGLQYVFIEARVGHIIAGHGSPNLSSPGMPRERGKR